MKQNKMALVAKLFGGLCFVALLAFNVTSVVNNENSSELSLSSLMNSAQAGSEIGDWWDRLDYKCVSVPCYTLGVHTHDADQAMKTEDGQGTVAHAWNCGLGC